jgi:serine/threonine protein kinase
MPENPAPTSTVIEILSGSQKGKRIKIPVGETQVFGRSDAVDVVLPDPSVSRIHCVFCNRNGSLSLSDMESAGGTLLNGLPIEEASLSDGDLIRIGTVRLRVHLGGDFGLTSLLTALDGMESDAERMIGQLFRCYKITRVIAIGKTSVVYEAENITTNGMVALRLVFQNELQDVLAQSRFTKSIELGVGIRHANIVPIIAAGRKHSYLWVAMTQIKGQDLRQLCRSRGSFGMLNWRFAFEIIKDITMALAELHKHRLVHRNITPSNIIVRDSDRRSFLNDFLFAQRHDGRKGIKSELVNELPEFRYVAPEVVRGKPSDIGTDIYSLGAVGYAIMTGRPPFRASEDEVLFEMIKSSEPESLRSFQLAVPELFQDVILQMLAKRREDRFQSPQELYQRLVKIENVIGYSDSF